MSAELIVIVVLALFFLMLAIEMPVAFALGFSGAIGTVMLHSFKVADSVLANVPFESTAKFSLVVIPLYIMLGAMATQARIPERVYTVINRVAGRFKGGLAIATIGASGGFAAVSGSSVATAATLGKISVRQMIRHGYSAELATGIVAIGATLGILIPPSIIMIMYSIMSGESIAALFSAGIVPGILSAVAYIITALILVKRDGRRISENAEVLQRVGAAGAGGSVDVTDVTAPTVSIDTNAGVRSSSLFAELRSVFWLVLIIAVVIVSIFTGLTTLSESAALAAVIATIALIAEHFKSGVRAIIGRIRDGLAESASVTSMAFAVVVGAGIFAYFLVSARVPNNLSRFFAGLDVPPILIVVLILLMMIPLGMFLDSLAVVVIVVPIVYPTIIGLGFDGIWFAILLVKLIEIGLLTPPVGMNCFVIAGVTGIKLETVFKGVAPFLACEAVLVTLLIVFPDIVLWLPNLMASMR
ncbi:tripartite ATP-independent transporter DctM subunit [Homoserinimonas aerilata]|uniref:Tripartite ATP-independent transporter DctM subunit n=1 Tax=Homoserinimonas aerilata TaxID=1162970 RepID=A0A542YFM0_9MICO|nr:TRAP transporter large permease [Homoserinimonas aerilata]TQL46764.1 tripartite ATP-independent transporter DctM subunit [Homoserinimonas aerilata]